MLDLVYGAAVVTTAMVCAMLARLLFFSRSGEEDRHQGTHANAVGVPSHSAVRAKTML
jgi:hypothetical protein